MLQENDVISCILTVGVVFFVLVNYRNMARIPRSNLLLSALLFFLLSKFFTVCTEFWLEAVFNVLDRGCYMFSLIFLAVWCRMIYRRGASGHA